MRGVDLCNTAVAVIGGKCVNSDGKMASRNICCLTVLAVGKNYISNDSHPTGREQRLTSSSDKDSTTSTGSQDLLLCKNLIGGEEEMFESTLQRSWTI